MAWFNLGKIKNTKDTGISRVQEGDIQRNIRHTSWWGFVTKPKEKPCLILKMDNSNEDIALVINNEKHDIKDNDIKITDGKSSIHFVFQDGKVVVESDEVVFKTKKQKMEGDELEIDFKKVKMKGNNVEIEGTSETKMTTAKLEVKASATAKVTSAKTEVAGIFNVKGTLANNGFDVGATHTHTAPPLGGPTSPPIPVPAGG